MPITKMKIKISKTGIYLSVFVATFTVVALTFAYMPVQVAKGGDPINSADVCKKADEFRKNNRDFNQYTALAALDNPIDKITDCFHETVNKMFNKKIKEMVKLGKTGKEDDLNKLITLITRPVEKGINMPCSSDTNNLSTYCLSEDLVVEFARFRKGMNDSREQLKANAAAQIEKVNSDFGANINRIDSEVKIAQTSIDQGLSAYNELQFALPLHMKYKKIIEELEDYRDALRKIRYSVDLYPVTFIDVTTAACN